MSPDYPTILLAGSDPDLLLLRSAMLASAGMWSVRVRNLAQAEQVLEFVDCDLAILCYTLDETEQQELTNVLLGRHKTVKVLSVATGDDCCGTGFLREVAEALHRPPAVSHAILEPSDSGSRMIR
jgi:DNA-binding NtrC family response regulator